MQDKPRTVNERVPESEMVGEGIAFDPSGRYNTERPEQSHLVGHFHDSDTRLFDGYPMLPPGPIGRGMGSDRGRRVFRWCLLAAAIVVFLVMR